MELPKRLWQERAHPGFYGIDSKEHQAVILEQYKLCVEMADRISQRRAADNSSSH
jgi:hypothetical protein